MTSKKYDFEVSKKSEQSLHATTSVFYPKSKEDIRKKFNDENFVKKLDKGEENKFEIFDKD